jgi:hypothetical protein
MEWQRFSALPLAPLSDKFLRGSPPREQAGIYNEYGFETLD